MADAAFDPAEFSAFKSKLPPVDVPAAPAGFDPAEFGAFKENVGQKASLALEPFYAKGLSTRNSAGQFVPEARALLTKAGVNPDAIDHKTEKRLIGQYEERTNPAGDESAAVGRGLINGVPVVGPYALSGLNKTAAFVRAVQNGTKYDDELRHVESFGNRTAEANPISTGAGELAGGVLGTAPLVAAAPAAFGIGGAKLAARAGAGLLSGSILGGADSAVRSDGDLGDTLTGAAIGGALGGAGPLAGRAVGGAIKKVAELNAEYRPKIDGISRPAAKLLIEDVKNSGGAERVQARLGELGDEGMLLDASPSLQGRAQGIAVRPETREAIVNPLEARNEGTNARVRAGLNEALGEAPVPSQVEAQFAAQRAKAGPKYEEALNGVRAVDANDALAEIAARLETASGAERAGLLRAREMLTQEGTNGGLVARSDPRYLHKAKGSIDDLIKFGDTTIGVPAGALSGEDGALMAVRRALNGSLEAQVPGYADANLSWRTARRASEALENAPRALSKGENAIHPADYAADLASRPMEQQAAQRAGVRAKLDRDVGTKANDLQALKQEVLEPSDWARQNLDQTFGPDAMRSVERTIDNNQTFRDSFANIVKNSQTEQRRQAAEGVAVRDLMPKGGASGMAVATGLGGATGAAGALSMKALKLGANLIGRNADLTRNREAARILTMRAGPERDALIETINARLTATDHGMIPANAAEKLVQQVLQAQAPGSMRLLADSR